MRRILVTIPHVFNPAGDPRYGSCQPDPAPRIAALSACLTTLRHNFGPSNLLLDRDAQAVRESPRSAPLQVDIVICTSGDLHLLDRLTVPKAWYTTWPTNVEPMLLGFECQRVLRNALGAYDFYCYLEDDIAIHDPAFFHKTAWFVSTFGSANVLNPNRYELGHAKLYIDGDIPRAWTAEIQDISYFPILTGAMLGQPIRFQRPLNPNAGCFFLTAEQMADWAAKPYFLDRDTQLVGPLESAANLGIMRSFRLYKPAIADAAFLEVEHLDRERWAQTVTARTWPAAHQDVPAIQQLDRHQ